MTLNDPVYFEAAQALGRRMAAAGDTTEAKVRYGFRLCLTRHPSDSELQHLVKLFDVARQRFSKTPELAKSIATVPIGAAPKDTKIVDLAAWTIVSNVLLNLDEMFLKR